MHIFWRVSIATVVFLILVVCIVLLELDGESFKFNSWSEGWYAVVGALGLVAGGLFAMAHTSWQATQGESWPVWPFMFSWNKKSADGGEDVGGGYY